MVATYPLAVWYWKDWVECDAEAGHLKTSWSPTRKMLRDKRGILKLREFPSIYSLDVLSFGAVAVDDARFSGDGRRVLIEKRSGVVIAGRGQGRGRRKVRRYFAVYPISYGSLPTAGLCCSCDKCPAVVIVAS